MEHPLSILEAEHQLMLRAMNIAEQIQQVNNDRRYHKLTRGVIIFFRNFTEHHHHPKEEDILYPCLKNRVKNMSDEFLHEICDHHIDLRAYIADMEIHFSNHQYFLLRNTLNEFIIECKEHIANEERVVLSNCKDLLTQNEWKKIGKDFQLLREKHGDLEELVNILDALEADLS